MVKSLKLLLIFMPCLHLMGCAALMEPRSDIQRSVDYLRQDVEKLTKQVEETSKKVDILLDRNKNNIECPPVIPMEKITVDDSSNLLKDPSTLYENGMKSMKEKRFDEAREIFAKFLMEYPQSELADNAQYWMGECFYSQKRFEEAKETFLGVLEHFPFGNKVPDALYKAALCAGQLGENEERVKLLNQVIENYPFSDAAEKASNLLYQIAK